MNVAFKLLSQIFGILIFKKSTKTLFKKFSKTNFGLSKNGIYVKETY